MNPLLPQVITVKGKWAPMEEENIFPKMDKPTPNNARNEFLNNARNKDAM